MKIVGVFILLALAWTAHALSTSPVDTVEVNFDGTTLVGWQACAIVPASTTSSFLVNVTTARCTGPHLAFACVQDGLPDTLLQFSGSNASVVTGNSTVNGTLNWFFDTNVGRAGYANGTAAPSSCLLASGTGICRNVNNGRFAPGMYCGPTIGYTISDNIALVVFSDPCGGSAIVGSACTNSAGLCETGNTCQANNTCSGGTALTPPALTPCTSDYTCQPETGTFTPVYLPVNSTCVSPTDLCAEVSVCDNSYQCVPFVNRTCPSFDPCKLDGACNSTSGLCVFPNDAPDGTACYDTNACTINKQCASGVCTGTLVLPVNITCQTPSTCNTTTGIWSYTPIAATTPCTPDSACVSGTVLGNNFQCDGGGSCLPTSTTNCSAQPVAVCYQPGICNATSASCVDPLLPAFTPCDDSDPCTQGTSCTPTGSCANGFPALACGSSGNPCQPLQPAPYNATLCLCQPTNATDNTTCSIAGAPCLLDTKCISGVCTGTTRTCPGDDCNAATTCSNTTGCSNPTNLGGACNRTCYAGATCDALGICVGGTRTPEVMGCAIAAAMRALDDWIFGTVAA